MALRERNALVLRVQGEERVHALDLHVHVRAQDLPHFNEDAALGGGAAVQVRIPALPRRRSAQRIHLSWL